MRAAPAAVLALPTAVLALRGSADRSCQDVASGVWQA